ncbi:GntR family transcriptional regulator [Herbiconiux solani]|uniref:GntR family transcriptional regulator n=1 Tax=Herbiconiux solani TaxID=661329 RepID=UPI000AF2600B|nr:GntR family transcriptional regulator [Herbiconiux solani]
MRVDLEHGRGEQPLYVQLANAVQDFIALERLKPGDILPSETVLASENHLSRATVIKAFDTLVERGVVTRRQGKGTFVNARPMQRQLPELTSFSEHVHGLGLAPGSTLLSFDLIGADSPERPASAFDDEPVGAEGALQPLVRVERLRTVGDAPVGIHRTFVPADVAERIGLTEPAAARPDFSFYGALRENGVHLDSGEESLRAINADAVDADLLGVEEGIALIEIVRASRDTTGRLVEVVRARYLGTQYLYHITFAPTSPGGHHEETPRTGTRTGGGLAAAQRLLGNE